MEYPRYAQPSHGFQKLVAVRSVAGLWQRCQPAETPDGIVARVWSADVFGVVTNGEIDNLPDMAVGLSYGVGPLGVLTEGVTPIVAKSISRSTLNVSLSAASAVVSSAVVTVTLAWSAITATPTTLDGYGIEDAARGTNTLKGAASIVGGGPLSAVAQTVRLVNDEFAPLPNQFYGTNAYGTRGYQALPKPLPSIRIPGSRLPIVPVDFSGIVARSIIGG